MKLVKWYKEQSTSTRVKLLVASFCTLIFVVAAPVTAWFVLQTQIDAMTKVNDPPLLNLASGGKDAIECFELRDINVNMKDGNNYSKDFVFSVEPGKISEYDLQLTHTTNIPFTYELYRAEKNNNGSVVYISATNGESRYSILGNNLFLDYNQDDSSSGRVLGNETGLPTEWQTYGQDDFVNIYAVPLYHVARKIQRVTEEPEGRDYFVLRVKWQIMDASSADNYWNYAFNNKETDIVYLSAAESK